MLGRYRIVDVLAKGGMGVIYLARSEGAAGFVKPVVIKRILSDMDEDNAMVNMFKREARIMSNLHHPGIVGVVDFGRDMQSYFMVLDYVHGFHLGRWKRFVNTVHGPFPAQIALHIVIQVLDALHYAHTLLAPDGSPLQVVHRDVTPSNVLIDVEGHVKLADFGIARTRMDATEVGQGEAMIKGKFPYLAPELLHGSPPSPVSDVYGCGVVLHEVLSGTNVFRGPSLSITVSRVMNHIPEPLDLVRPDITPTFSAVVAKALHKDPRQRFQSALEFAQTLRHLRADSTESAQAKLAAAVARDFFDPKMAEFLNVDDLASLDRSWRKAPSATNASFQPAAYVSSMPPQKTDSSIPLDISEVIDVEKETNRPTPRRGIGMKVFIGMVGFIAFVALAVGVLAWYTNVHAARSRPKEFVYVESGRVASDDELGQSRPLPDTTHPPEQHAPTELSANAPSEREGSQAVPKEALKPRAPRQGLPALKGPDVRQLSATVQKRSSQFTNCFKTHLQGQSSVKVTLGFSVAKEGHVTQVDVRPAEVARGPLGQCLRSVAGSIAFGPQSDELVFSVPISTQLE